MYSSAWLTVTDPKDPCANTVLEQPEGFVGVSSERFGLGIHGISSIPLQLGAVPGNQPKRIYRQSESQHGWRFAAGYR